MKLKDKRQVNESAFIIYNIYAEKMCVNDYKISFCEIGFKISTHHNIYVCAGATIYEVNDVNFG